ncbi:RloB domain-containing protein [Bosea eneae]|jgi:hypothetical protein|uniref:RloB domain-containing protein n=1 Tax=Bosea eneae TaxID=151454 RepID=A0ABW0IRS7_9HYPH
MRTRRAFIPPRRPIFIGCEGESEQGYAGFLQDLVREADLPVHLMIEVLGPGAGDPLSRVEMAVRKLAHLRRTRAAPVERFVLLDTDQAEMDRDRAERARRLAGQEGIQIVWQEPCFEALLLRHFPNRAANRPPDNQAAQRAIEREWAGYAKPASRAELARRVDLQGVVRASAVEPDLKAMLRCIGLIGEN